VTVLQILMEGPGADKARREVQCESIVLEVVKAGYGFRIDEGGGVCIFGMTGTFTDFVADAAEKLETFTAEEILQAAERVRTEHPDVCQRLT
jgi:hypothetical protein